MAEVPRTGFEDAEEPEDAEPEELSAWLAAGFGRQPAQVWRRWRFTVALAQAWGREGIDDGLQAAQWRTAGATPATVQQWRAAGIDAAEAVRWHEFGFNLKDATEHKKKGLNPDAAFAGQQHRQASVVNVVRSARMVGGGGVLGWGGPAGPLVRFQRSGVEPHLVQGYMQHHWFDEAAAEWARHGIEAQDAYVWFDLGLTASEAGRLTTQGRTPGDVVREWWTAGIPFEEMAEWIGAGLSAHEAVEQRANGITVEHAASLRALRVGETAHQQGEKLPAALLARIGPPRSEPVGPPPDDEEGARLAIKDAFAGMLTGDGDGNVSTVERGARLGECLQEAARRHGIPEGEPGNGATVTADFIRFVNDHEARVSFTVVVGSPRNMNLGARVGRAVLIEGVWKVAQGTFCEFMHMAGVECPPSE